MVCLTGITFSCSEDDYSHQHTELEMGTLFQKRTISFAEMKNKLSGKDVKSLALGIANKGGDDYIVSIDSTAVTEIINDSLTTYTLRVYTQDEENYAYSNLIIKEVNSEIEEYIAHYTPTPEWQAAYDSGNYTDYQGEIAMSDTDGNDLGETGKSPCTFSIESAMVCTCEGHIMGDPVCTCTTFTNYYYLKMICGDGSPNGGNGPGDPGEGDFGLPTLPHGGQQGGGGSGNYNYTAFNAEFIPLLTMPQINWLENHPDIFLQIYNYLQSYGEPTEYGWYDNYQAVEFAVEWVLELYNGNNEYQLNQIFITFQNNYRDQMSQEELTIFDTLSPQSQFKYLRNAYYASRKAENLYPSSLYNGKGDAFRHAYFNAKNVISIGIYYAEILATAHENRPPNYQYEYKEVEMDLFNNQIGRIIGQIVESDPDSFDMLQMTINHINTGSLRYLNNLQGGGSSGQATAQSNLIPTNQ